MQLSSSTLLYGFCAAIILTGCGSSSSDPVTSELTTAELRSALETVYGAANVTEGPLSLEETYSRQTAELTLQIACDPTLGCTGYTLQDQDRDRINQFNNNPLPNPYGVGRVVRMMNTYTYTQMVQAIEANATVRNKPAFGGRVDMGAFNYGDPIEAQINCVGSQQPLRCGYMHQNQNQVHTSQGGQQNNRFTFDLSSIAVGTHYLECNATNSAGTTTLADAIKVTRCDQNQSALQNGSCQEN